MQIEHSQDELINIIQKHVVNFCKIIPGHVEKWRTLLQEVQKPVQALVNYSEQLRHVEKENDNLVQGFLSYYADRVLENYIQDTADICRHFCHLSRYLNLSVSANIKYIDEFKELQERLLYKIYIEIDSEIILIKGIVDRLNLANQELKNKLWLLEKSTIDLDWEIENFLIKGTAFQPPLSKILQKGLEFVMLFSNTYKSISESLKTLNVRREEVMKNFKNNFTVNLEQKIVIDLLALVQYVGNEKAIT